MIRKLDPVWKMITKQLHEEGVQKNEKISEQTRRKKLRVGTLFDVNMLPRDR